MSHFRPLNIKVISGEAAGFEFFAVDQVSVTIGRDGSNDVVLKDRGVSRKHCKFTLSDGIWLFHDLGSTNGVTLTRDAAQVATEIRSDQVRVETGDVFEVGHAKIRVDVSTAMEETELLLGNLSSESTELLAPIRRPSETLDSHEDPAKFAADFFSERSDITLLGNRKTPFPFRNYQVLKKIGEGGMGEVYLAARHDRQTPELAIKFLRTQKALSADDRARFMREMEISARLKHTSIIACVDCGEEDGHPFIVMPYCSGGNLAELLKRSGKLTLRRGLRLLDRLLAGVEHAHQAGIVHRDLKPFNVLLAREGERRYSPKISDFGLAKSYLLAGESGMTVNGTVGGSWGYMPREQLTNFRFVSPQSDVWSLGAIIYECLTLKLPRPLQPGVEPIKIVLESTVVPIDELLPNLPVGITRFIMKSLAPEAVDRYQDSGAMRAALRTAAGHENIDL